MEGQFMVVAAGGAEGCGDVGRCVRALVAAEREDVTVEAICGRNGRPRRSLERHRPAAGQARLLVKGWVDNMADWMRCADLLVTKAGPSTLAEAACAGALRCLSFPSCQARKKATESSS